MGNQTFTSATSAARLEILVDFVFDNDGLTTKQIAAELGWNLCAATDYLNHAAKLKMVHKMRRAKRVGHAGLVPHRWAAGPLVIDPKAQAIVEGRRVHPVTKVHVQRDPLTAAFFGPAQHKTN